MLIHGQKGEDEAWQNHQKHRNVKNLFSPEFVAKMPKNYGSKGTRKVSHAKAHPAAHARPKRTLRREKNLRKNRHSKKDIKYEIIKLQNPAQRGVEGVFESGFLGFFMGCRILLGRGLNLLEIWGIWA